MNNVCKLSENLKDRRLIYAGQRRIDEIVDIRERRRDGEEEG